MIEVKLGELSEKSILQKRKFHLKKILMRKNFYELGFIDLNQQNNE